MDLCRKNISKIYVSVYFVYVSFLSPRHDASRNMCKRNIYHKSVVMYLLKFHEKEYIYSYLPSAQSLKNPCKQKLRKYEVKKRNWLIYFHMKMRRLSSSSRKDWSNLFIYVTTNSQVLKIELRTQSHSLAWREAKVTILQARQ